MILLNRKFGQIFFFGEYWWAKCFLGTSVVSEEKKEKKKWRSNKDFLDVGED